MSFYMYKYDSLPTLTPLGFWYASWSTTEQDVSWSQSKPTTVPDGKSSWVVGVGDDDDSSDAMLLTDGGTGKCLPPQPALRADSLESFQSAFVAWVDGIKGLDLAE